MKRTISLVALVLVTLFVVIVYYVPLGHVDFAEDWGEGTFGVEMGNQSGDVTAVLPGSPAARAGIEVGDVIESSAGPQEWSRIRSGYPGEREHFTVDRGSSRRVVTLTAVPLANFGIWQRLGGILAVVPGTIFLAVAVVLVFIRPTIMSWAFYIFAVGYFGTGPVFEYWSHVLSPPAYAAMSFALITVFGAWSVLPLLFFVLRFPNGDVLGWRRKVDPYVWAFAGLAYIGYVVDWRVLIATGHLPAWAEILETVIPLFAFVAAALIVAKNYAVSAPSDRQRWSFVAIGTIASFLAYAIYYVPGVPFAVGQVIGFGVVLMPICIAYAIFRLRVIDVNFVLNRAAVYGSMSIAIIAFISLLDWLLSRVVSIERLATGIELLVTIGIGFLLDRINRVIERFVDAVFFRRRHLAEDYLRRAAEALPYATDESAIAQGLVDVPVEALRLAAAALYRRSADETRFEGVATSAQTLMAPAGFDANHLLVRMLLAGEKSVWLDELRAHLDPQNAAIYALAVPVSVRHQLVSFTLYGAHTNGAQLDPEELVLLEDLAREASRAYDHVEAVRTRERYARLSAAPIGGVG